jgi:hypothetical protein
VWLTCGPSFALVIASLGTVATNSGGTLPVLRNGRAGSRTRQVFLQSRIAASQLLKATILYLPLEFLILVLGKG